MSGGSFNYLYAKTFDDLAAWNGRTDLKEMVTALEDLGADDIAAEADSVLRYLELAERRIDARLKRLSDVFRAVEWYRSCDYSRDQALEAVETWRTEREK